MRDVLIKRVTESLEASGGPPPYKDYIERLCDSLELAHAASSAYRWYLDHLCPADGEAKILGGLDFWLARLAYELRVLERALEDFGMHTRIGGEDDADQPVHRKETDATFYRVDARIREVFKANGYVDNYETISEAGRPRNLPMSSGLAKIYQELDELATDVNHLERETVPAQTMSHVLMDMELMLGYKTLPRLGDMSRSVRRQWARVKY